MSERVEPECYQALQEVVGGCPILADLAGHGADDIGIVFGEDCYDTIVTGMTWKLRNGLKGTPTIFGWILHGGSRSPPAAGVVARANAHAFRATVHEQLQNFWTLDHLGVVQEEVLEPDLELEVKNAVQRDESGKYVVSWPWKPQARKNLALNKALCETRLRVPFLSTMPLRKDQTLYHCCGAYFSVSVLARLALWVISKRLFYSCRSMIKTGMFVVSCGLTARRD